MLKVKIPEPIIKTAKNNNINEEQECRVDKQLAQETTDLRLRLNIVPEHSSIKEDQFLKIKK